VPRRRVYLESRQPTVKETFSVIASAWSTVLIVLFLYSALSTPVAPALTEDAAYAILILFVGAVTGAGWLWHRHILKRGQHSDVDSPSSVL